MHVQARILFLQIVPTKILQVYQAYTAKGHLAYPQCPSFLEMFLFLMNVFIIHFPPVT